MSKKNASRIQWAGCLIIVVSMLLSHYLIKISETVMIVIASVSFVMIAAGMIRLKIIAAREEKTALKKNRRK